MGPLVSVYIPTRNRRPLLEKAVASVLAQDHTELDLIVVDDSSTDDTADWVRSRALADPRVRLIVQPRSQGAPAARNAALRAARGDFATGLDDDDQFSGDRLSQFVRSWTEYQANGQRPAFLYSHVVALNKRDTQRRAPRQASYEDLFGANVVGNQVFAPLQNFIDVGGFDETLPAWQDLDLFLRMAKRFGNGLLCDAPTYYLDDQPRTDRISADGAKVRRAFDIIRSKNAVSSLLIRDLFSQMFRGYYNVMPTGRDYAFALSGPRKLDTVLILLKQSLRSAIRRGQFLGG